MSNEQNVATGKAICEALGGTFQQPHESNESYFYCVLPDGVRFSIRLGGWALKGRISFGSAYPKYICDEHGGTRQSIQRDFDRGLRYGQTGFDGITVADTKSPEQVAKDVQRRFLPAYRELWPKAVEYCQQQADYWTHRNGAKEAIDAALLGKSGFYIRSYSEGSASIELYSVTPEMAKALAALLPSR